MWRRNMSKADLRDFVLTKFKEKGFMKDKKYSRERILNFLDKRGATDFDRDISNQLFEQCEVSTFENVKLETFIDSYVLAIETLRKKLKETNIKHHSLEAEYKEKKKEKKQNTGPEPIDEETFDLFIRVNGGEEFQFPGVLNHVSPFVSIKVGGLNKDQIKRTKEKENEANPYWAEDFEFLKLNEKTTSYVEFRVYHQEKVKDPTLLGKKKIYLRDFRDQQRRELRVNFDDKNGDEIKVQCVSSYDLLNKQQIDELRDQIGEVSAAHDDYSDALVALYLPFPEVYDEEKDKVGDKAVNNKFERVRKTVNQNKSASVIQYQPEDPFETWGNILKQNKKFRNLFITISIFVLILLFTSLERNMFLDLFLILMIVGNIFIWLQINVLFSVKVAVGLLIQSIFELIWFIRYVRHWWRTKYIDDASQESIRFFTLFSSIMLFFIRIVLAIMVFMAGNVKIEAGTKKKTLNNQYNMGVRNDDYFVEPEFSEDSFAIRENFSPQR